LELGLNIIRELDDIFTIMQDIVPGMEDPVVYIGVVEKGWAMLELSVDGIQGHSSMPPKLVSSSLQVVENKVCKYKVNSSCIKDDSFSRLC
jgi:hypothetical protein